MNKLPLTKTYLALICISFFFAVELEAQEFYLDSTAVTNGMQETRGTKYRYDENNALKEEETLSFIKKYSYSDSTEITISTIGKVGNNLAYISKLKYRTDGQSKSVEDFSINAMGEEEPEYSQVNFYNQQGLLESEYISKIYTIQYYESFYPYSSRFLFYDDNGLLMRDSLAYYTGGDVLNFYQYDELNQRKRLVEIHNLDIGDYYVDTLWIHRDENGEVENTNSSLYANGSLESCDSIRYDNEDLLKTTTRKSSADCNIYNYSSKNDTFYSGSPYLEFDSLRKSSLTSTGDISIMWERQLFKIDTSKLIEGEYSIEEEHYKYNSFYDEYSLRRKYSLYKASPEIVSVEEVVEEDHEEEILALHPNPVSTNTELRFTDVEMQFTHFELYTVVGETILSGKINLEIEYNAITSPSIPGIYFFKIYNQSSGLYEIKRVLVIAQ